VMQMNAEGEEVRTPPFLYQVSDYIDGRDESQPRLTVFQSQRETPLKEIELQVDKPVTWPEELKIAGIFHVHSLEERSQRWTYIDDDGCFYYGSGIPESEWLAEVQAKVQISPRHPDTDRLTHRQTHLETQAETDTDLLSAMKVHLTHLHRGRRR